MTRARKNNPAEFWMVVSKIYFNKKTKSIWWKAKSDIDKTARLSFYWGAVGTQQQIKTMHSIRYKLNERKTVTRAARIRIARKVGGNVDDFSGNSDPLKNSVFLIDQIFKPLHATAIAKKRRQLDRIHRRIVGNQGVLRHFNPVKDFCAALIRLRIKYNLLSEKHGMPIEKWSSFDRTEFMTEASGFVELFEKAKKMPQVEFQSKPNYW